MNDQHIERLKFLCGKLKDGIHGGNDPVAGINNYVVEFAMLARPELIFELIEAYQVAQAEIFVLKNDVWKD